MSDGGDEGDGDDGGDDEEPPSASASESTGTEAESETASDEEGVDWEMAPDSEATFEADEEKVRLLREVAEELYGDSSESRQVSAIVYRISDLYDEDGDTSPEEIYLNVRHIMDIKEQGGLRPNR